MSFFLVIGVVKRLDKICRLLVAVVTMGNESNANEWDVLVIIIIGMSLRRRLIVAFTDRRTSSRQECVEPVVSKLIQTSTPSESSPGK